MSVKQIVLRIVGTIGLLQVVTVAILWVVSTMRARSRKKVSFPHPHLEPVQLGKNTLQIYSYGRELYDAMLAAIDEAEDCIYLESFIWKGDDVGEEFKAHLTRKAEQGVAVYVIFDGFGNLVVPRAFKSFPSCIHSLEYQAFRNPTYFFDIRRYSLDHRKLLVVDGKTGFIGGYNIGSLYATEWRDTHLRISGPAANDLAQSFVEFWNRFCHKGDAITRRHTRRFDPLINLRGNDALRLTFPIRDMYIDAIDNAEHTICLTNAYFVPDTVLFDALKSAAKRGVDVRVLVPWYSNHVVVDWLARRYFTACLEAGIHVFGYYHTMLHAKTCTIDGQWSTIGTANLDRLSSIGNYEINVEIYSKEFARQMEVLFKCDTSDAFELTLEDWSHRPWYKKFGEAILAPLGVVM
ncbi:MAG: phosphatidylserine/phosphatidylglycerophosphate/cardiolipin synthase family protein [Ktedonobacteraceae bacterium]|nr:phosphatidylserine/phosphatidylglycerophosphate/cardiolipin synthase family protein [Ktedonobacteraceae bacterium]